MNVPLFPEKDLSLSIQNFIRFLNGNGFSSYDQYDFWNTQYGIFSKKVYYKNKYLGIPFVAPVFTLELLAPATRKLVTTRKRFPIADAHLIMGYLNLYTQTEKEEYLKTAESIATDLMKTAITNFDGTAWGYPFDWMTTRGLWKRGTPLITSTPYCFEAFLQLYDVTGNKSYLDTAYSIYLFALKTIKDSPIDEKQAASSYSPFDQSMILNASAYRSMVLTESYKRFGESQAKDVAEKNINFILSSQLESGAWLYAMNDERDAFIDNFHTCFVLKNLYKSNRILQQTSIKDAILKGYRFYKSQLLDEQQLPIPFAKAGRFNIVKRELYDFAEGINLGCLLKDADSDALPVASNLIRELLVRYQKKDGSFVTRVNFLNGTNRVTYLRWPQAQLFMALTTYLITTQPNKAENVRNSREH